MTAKFQNCLDFTYIEENGYQCLTDDTGNWYNGRLIGTNRGISARVLAEWLGPKRSNLLTQDYMKSLPKYVSDAIYAQRYWNAMLCEQIQTGVDLMVFDFGVNDGDHASAWVLQETLHFTGEDIDGWIGQETMAALLQCDVQQTIDNLYTAQVAYYKTLKNWARFGRTWQARSDRRKAKALQLASLPPVASA